MTGNKGLRIAIAGGLVAIVAVGAAAWSIAGLNAKVGQLNAQVVQLEDKVSGLAFYDQVSRVEQYVVLGEDVDIAGLQTLLNRYDTSRRVSIDEPLSKLGIESVAMSSGDVVPLSLSNGGPAGAWVFFRTYQELGGLGYGMDGKRLDPPNLQQVATAAFGVEPPVTTDLGVNIAKGLSKIAVPTGLKITGSDGTKYDFRTQQARFDYTTFVAKSN